MGRRLRKTAEDFLFSSAKEVKSLCKEIFNKTGLSYFSYRRYYDDGNALFLSTCPAREKYYVENNMFPTFSEYDAQKQIGSRFIFMSEDMPLPEGMSKKNSEKYLANVINASAFKIHHRLIFFTTHLGYTRLCSFAIDNSSKAIFETYLNKNHELELFITEFEERAKTLIEQGSQHRIALPGYRDAEAVVQAKEMDPFGGASPWLKLLSTDLMLGPGKQSISLTRRELECLVLQQFAFSAKETANLLSISFRTVETHLKNAKDKVGPLSKVQLKKVVLSNAYCRAFLKRLHVAYPDLLL